MECVLVFFLLFGCCVGVHQLTCNINGNVKIYNEYFLVTQHGQPSFKTNLCKDLVKNCTSNNVICKTINSTDTSFKKTNNHFMYIQNPERTIVIKFHCNEQKFANITENTDRKLILNFPSATCPNMVDIPHTDFRFNTTAFHEIKPVEVSLKGSKYILSVHKCGYLNVSTLACVNDQHLAVVKMDSKNHVKTIVSGGMVISYTAYKGIEIHYGIGSYKTTINVLCGTNPEFTFIKLQKKIIYLKFITEKACLDLPTDIDCKVQDVNAYTYDLNPLKNRNQVVSLPKSNSKIHFNVCGRLIHENLPPDCYKTETFACLTTPDESRSIGSMMSTPNPVISNDILNLEYINGMHCANGTYANMTIEFECGFFDAKPEFKHVDEDGCRFIVAWKTKHACPHARMVGKTDCTVLDNFFSFSQFDLSSLRSLKRDRIVVSHNGEKFRINVCGRLLASCAGFHNASVCFTPYNGREVPIAFENSTVLFEDGRLEFILTGPPCRKSSNNVSVVRLMLHCDTSKVVAEDSMPELFPYQGDICHFNFVWRTSLACPKYKPETDRKCNVSDNSGNEYDLSELVRHSSNYEVSSRIGNSTIKFLLNICEPTVYKYDSTCTRLPSVCMVNVSEPRIDKRFKSIGYSNLSPYFNTTANLIQLQYMDQLDINISRVDIQCDIDSKDPKVHIRSHTENHYHFVLSTSSVCSPAIKNSYAEKEKAREDTCENIDTKSYQVLKDTDGFFKSSECTIHNPGLGTDFDLGSLTGMKEIEAHNIDMENILNMCSHLTNFVKIDKEMFAVEIVYIEKNQHCPRCESSTTLILHCDQDGSSELLPKLQKSTPCQNTWIWRTNKICPVLGISPEVIVQERPEPVPDSTIKSKNENESPKETTTIIPRIIPNDGTSFNIKPVNANSNVSSNLVGVSITFTIFVIGLLFLVVYRKYLTRILQLSFRNLSNRRNETRRRNSRSNIEISQMLEESL